jgi:DNA-binding beta-propeller fold protein YncE
MISALMTIALSAILASSAIEYMAVTPEIIDGLPMNNPQGLAVNPRTEEFLVADALNDRILIFDTTGSPVFDFPLGDDRHTPFGIAVDSAGEIIVGAMDESVLWVYDYNGGFIDEISLPEGVLPGRLISVSKDEILLIDRAGKEILMIDQDGKFLSRYESTGTQYKPSGICRDKAGELLLISSSGNVVNSVDPTNKIRSLFGEHGRRPEDFSFPTAIAADDAGGLWVVDSFRHELKHFDSTRKFIGTFGTRGGGQG